MILRQAGAVYNGNLDVSAFDESQRQLITNIWGAILKHRWLILGVLVLSLVLGVTKTLMTTPLYTSKALIQIDREASKVIDMGELAPIESASGSEFIETQIGLLRSEALARRTVVALNLVRDPAMREIAGLPPLKANQTPAEATRAENALTGLLMANTEVAQQGMARLVRVSFTSPDPKIAARVANGLASNFQTLAMERRFDSSAYARKFLEGRIAQVKQKLEESERQLVEYGADQQIINVNPNGADTKGQGDSAGQSLTAADLSRFNAMLTEVKGERIRAEQRWRQAEPLPALSLPETLSDPTVQSLLGRQASLQTSYEEKQAVYLPAAPEMLQLKAQIDDVDRKLNIAASRVKEGIRGRYEVALRQERSLSAQVESQKGSFTDLRRRNIQNTILQREVDTNRTLYDDLLQRYKEVGVAGGVDSTNIAVIDPARPSGAPVSPSLPRNLALALFLGLLVAGAVVMLLELLDEAVRTPDDVQAKLGLTVLGVIPELEKGVSPISAMADPRSDMTEAYASTRAATQFITPDGVPASILVTSSRPSEGKSTTALGLARSFANLDLRILLIDADLRNPSVHRLVGCENSSGLSNCLTGVEWQGVVQATGKSGMYALTSGPLPPNPSELLSSSRFTGLLMEARNHFDLIIIDGPPVIGLADAPILGSCAEATLLVIEAGKARRSVSRIAIRRLVQARAKIAGAILTKFNATSAGHGYGYGYSAAYAYNYTQLGNSTDSRST
ncbi:polysaccharide biosynthesis tyrosine autokinase [Caulobacter sp. NIBR1757]|uniref:GumC family protein n=1 Tax=Caulobacter sp. NIBR1757 TaxID=3016000 RepID=UPI0022F142ED|nr:polysaccharide biosynthesis tyrosine autokinase [Caulobacter sp. NIBR1757]